MVELIVEAKWNAPYGYGHPTNLDAPPSTSGPQLEGSGGHAVDADTDTVTGTGVGQVSGNAFRFTVSWSNGARSEYTGAIQSNGRLTGISRDFVQPTHPGSRFSYSTFR
jgi:hypothetical protein